jgi:hypothetical protein
MQRTHAHIQLKDPADLRPHPLKKQLPKPLDWQKGGEAFHALVDDVRDRGIDTPLLITSAGEILDGEVRWLAAKQLKPAADAASIILGALLQRQHLTKSALAYLAFPLLAPALEETRRRQLANLRRGAQIPESTQTVLSGAKTAEQLAERLGVSRVLFFHAQKLRETFTKRPELRAQFEPPLLSGEAALGATLAGIAGQEATKGKGKNVAGQLDLFEAGFGTLKTRFTYWQRFDDAAKAKARTVIQETVAEMPDDLRDEFERAIRAAKKPQLKAA